MTPAQSAANVRRATSHTLTRMTWNPAPCC